MGVIPGFGMNIGQERDLLNSTLIGYTTCVKIGLVERVRSGMERWGVCLRMKVEEKCVL